MVTTAIFDIGGVLITPSEKVTPLIISQILSIPVEVAVSEYNQAIAALRTGKNSVTDMVNRLNSRYQNGMTVTDLDHLYSKFYKQQAVINTEIMGYLKIIHERIVTVAFSNMIDIHVRCNRERQLFQYFHKVYLSSVTGWVKPDKSAFDHILNDLKVSPSDCIFVDDKQENVDVATGLGMVATLYDTPEKLCGFLEKQGVI